ncbi:hypothetical protein CYY_005082 [Polysphondylium violaceum]|uniref:Sestrin-like protein n=1 Tax=Polysphondylium violaceum TaxID=133409 RepID=A0A8J4PUW5_9MYCE|nr:hypothetical protein CYY_005082 [Polysphondylium violaceum]
MMSNKGQGIYGSSTASDTPYGSDYSPPQSPSLSEPLSAHFLSLQTTDSSIRKSAIEHILSILTNPENEKLVKNYLNTIIVLATESPFDDITEAFSSFIKTIQDKYHIPKQRTTYYINDEQLPKLNTQDELTSKLFQDVFIQNGRVNHLTRILGWHPQYLERFLSAYNTIMKDPGPLPITWRNYIGILAAARYNCSYIVSLQEHEFLQNNGDPRWLQGIEFIPAKLKNLLKVIELMAHQPWLLPKLDIEYLVKGSDAWSIAELVQAMVLITTFLSLSGLVFCCGIAPEVGLSDSNGLGGSFSINDSDAEIEDTSASENTANLMELLKNRKSSATNDEDDDSEEHDRQQDFHNAGIESSSSNSTTSSSSLSSSTLLSSSSGEQGSTEKKSTTATVGTQTETHDFSRYKGNYNLSHTDFDVSSREYSIFSVQEYSWKEHGYELVSRYFPDAAPLLEEEFSFVYTMTYYEFNNNPDIDTLPFRRAVWYYVQRVKGMCHDDYNYQEVNMFLSISLKNFVKKAACFPDTIKRDDFSKLGYHLKPDEKAHLSLLAVCSHKQASLLYGLYTVMEYQNRR